MIEHDPFTLFHKDTCAELSHTYQTSVLASIEVMQSRGFDQLPVTSTQTNKLVGLVTLGNLLAKVASSRVQLTDTVGKVMFNFNQQNKFTEITVDTPLESLSKFFENHSNAVVTEKGADGGLVVKHVVTKVDLLAWLVRRTKGVEGLGIDGFNGER